MKIIRAFLTLACFLTFTSVCSAQTVTIVPVAAPTSLTASVISSNQVNLLWDMVNNYNSVSGYQLFRNGVKITTVSGGLTNTYIDNNLSANTAYSYQIKTVDSSGNTSSFNLRTMSIITPLARSKPATFYVSPSGNDANSGTIDLPWKTIQKALNTLVAGDILYLKGGTYSTLIGGWVFKNSGTSAQPITVSNFLGEQVILSLPADIGTWTSSTPSSNYSAFRCWSTEDWLTPKSDYIRIIGTPVSATTLSNGLISTKGIVIQGPDPGTGYNTSTSIRVSDCDYWEVAGTDFVDMGFGIFTYIRNNQTMANRSADHWYVHDNRVYGFWRETGFQFDGPYNRVENNEIYKVVNDAYTPFGCQGLNFLSHHNIIKGNIISKLGSTYSCTGLLFEWDLADYNIVEGNNIYNNNIGFNVEGGDNNIIRNNLIYQNTVYNQWSGGIQINSFDNTIYTSWPCDEQKSGGTSVNILPANNPIHPEYQYYYNPRNCHSWGNQIYNNTISNYGVGIKFSPLFPENTVVRNNVSSGWIFGGVCFYETSTGHCLTFPTGAIIDHNVDSGNFSFKDPANSDFHLSAGSPLIDSGYNLGSLVANDFDGIFRPLGTGFDIGAYEFTPPATPTPTPTTGATVKTIVDNRSSYLGSNIPKYSKFELTFDVTGLSTIFPTDTQGKFTDLDLNPFNQDVVDITGVFSPPGCNFGSGCILQVPGFWYQDFTLTDTDGTPIGESATAGQTKWKIRFTPQTIGTYQYYIKVTENGLLTAQTGNYSFVSVTSANKGFIRMDTNTHYFRFDNGTSYNPVGMNITHVSTTGYSRMFNDFSSNGMNFGRFTDAYIFFKLEWVPTSGQCMARNCQASWYQGLGRYNLVAGYRLDQVINLAENSGVYLDYVWGGAPDEAVVKMNGVWSWPNNPYNIANGGIVSNNYDFFSNTAAKDYVKRKLRYDFSRWGYSPAVFAWESLNEIDNLIVNEGWKTDTAKWQAVNSWHQEMVTYLKSLDIYHHLNTGSTTKGPAKIWTANPNQNYWRAYWDLPIWNFISYHEYNDLATNYSDMICAIDTAVDTLDVVCNDPYSPNTKTLLTNHGYPMVFGEWGLNGSSHSIDFTQENMHDAIWTAALNGATLLPWWSENVASNGWLPRFKALALFFQNEDLGKSNMARVRFPVAQPVQLQAYGLSNGAKILGWIKNTGTAVDGSVTFPNMQNGNYAVEIWDPWTGVKQGTTTNSVNNGQLTISLTGVNHSIAFKAYFIQVQGDANGDGRVDGLDYVVWLNNYGGTTTQGSTNGDFNADGRVDGLDYVIWLNNYGR